MFIDDILLYLLKLSYMKNLLLSFVFALITVLTFGQRFDEATINLDTHDTLISTHWKNLEKGDSILISFRFMKINSKYFLDLKFHFGGVDFSVLKNDSVKIKLVSGFSFTLFANNTVKSANGLASYPGSFAGSVTPGVHVSYPLTIGEVLGLSDTKIDKIRIYSSKGSYTYILSESNRFHVMTLSQQILLSTDYFEYTRNAEAPVTKKSEEDPW